MTALDIGSNYFCTVSLDRFLKVYDSATGKLKKSLFQLNPLTALIMHHEEAFVLFGNQKGSLKRISLENFEIEDVPL